MYEFVVGASAMACVVIALFFLRFWRHTRDRFFVLFALAFAVFAANRLALVLVDGEGEMAVYIVRAVAFGLIIVAIVDKNRVARPSPSHLRTVGVDEPAPASRGQSLPHGVRPLFPDRVRNRRDVRDSMR